MNISPILTDIKKRKFQPIYLLHGEESYFIDVISDALEHTVLNDAQKGFDQTVLYGKDTDFSTIVSAAKRYPMMSDHQLIIIKEAQDLKWKDDELLLKYVEQCTASTVLVFDYKYGKFDKRKKLYKAIEKKGLVVESNKLYDDKIAAWVISYLKEQGWNIHPQAAALLSEYLGTELSKIVNELNKLMLNVPKEREILVSDIEQNIGISKDFNVFELNTALAKRNALKAYQIVDYFAANPKSNPLVLVLGTIAGYFTKILKYHYIVDKSTAAKELGVHPFFLKEYELAARNYNRRKTFAIIEALKDADLKSKGMNIGSNTTTKDILTELIFTILN
ncbi:DNA polymerase III subunit delta [Sphingobacterium faecium NBRC 15299]|jgi:DNA polymerase-3 subunit delta|uniref:DNA polymerase III subunit delta n=1 Tax=Sphingobacterium faecium TaxID=34087 RepID=UPI000D35C46F|nr:DNA polymerase III subunit delta [Sphingobacterium faecium]PTX13706.1 DNA polymerase III delta subunit [Sphingobacterium faecium]GEM64705.1 DNA polymerase III subunit delta [Sphingobacterium faecium NBRC 15299]